MGLYESILSGDLTGNDVNLANPLATRDEPTRSDNCYHVISYNENGKRRTDLHTELDGFVITGGHALFFKEGSVISTTTPEWNCGGGLFIRGYDGTIVKVIVRSCEFTDNYSEAMGGGLYCYFVSDLSVIGCSFTDNGSHIHGGGMDLGSSGAVLTSCQFCRNAAGRKGGGARTAGHIAFRHCAFVENTADDGGGIMIDAGSVKASDSRFLLNYAARGGAVMNRYNSNAEFMSCHYVSNAAKSIGGAIVQADLATSLTLGSCILSGNTAGESGGAIWKAYGKLDMMSCITVGSRAPQGQFLLEGTPLDIGSFARGSTCITNSIILNGADEIRNDAGLVTLRYTDIPNGATAIHDPNAMVIWGNGNIARDPCFVDPGYWDPNGTSDDPNDDFWIDGDYHLKSQAGRWDPNSQTWVKDSVTSACIDAGDPNSPIGGESFPNGGRINMGVYGGTVEASKSYFGEPVCETQIAGDINGDCRVDAEDLAMLSRNWLRDERPESVTPPSERQSVGPRR